MSAATTDERGPAAVTALVATEALLVQDALAALRAAARGPLPELNEQTVELGGEQGVMPLLEAARTVPMMAPRRFVHGRGLERIAAKEAQALIDYVQDPVPSTVLVLTGNKLDGRSKLAQALRRAGVLQLLEGPRPHELPRWIGARAQAAHARIEPAAAARLAELVGPDLGVLVSSLEKLALHAGAGRAIGVANVDAVVAHTRDASVFALTAAMGRRDWAVATTCLRQLLSGGEAPLLLLNMMVRQLRLLLATRQSRSSGHALAGELGVRPFVVDELVRHARNFTEAELLHALQAAQSCDVALKSSRVPAALHLERLLLVLCAPAAHA